MKKVVLTLGMVLALGAVFAQNTEPVKKVEKVAVKKKDVEYTKKSEVKAVKLDTKKQIVPAKQGSYVTRKKVVTTKPTEKK